MAQPVNVIDPSQFIIFEGIFQMTNSPYTFRFDVFTLGVNVFTLGVDVCVTFINNTPTQEFTQLIQFLQPLPLRVSPMFPCAFLITIGEYENFKDNILNRGFINWTVQGQVQQGQMQQGQVQEVTIPGSWAGVSFYGGRLRRQRRKRSSKRSSKRSGKRSSKRSSKRSRRRLR